MPAVVYVIECSMLANLTWILWNLSMVFVFISLIARESEHFFIYLLATWTCPFEKCSCPLPISSQGCFATFSVWSFVCKSWILLPYLLYNVQIFFFPFFWLLTLSIISFEPKDSIKRLLELIREFGRVAGHKINEHKSVALAYTNNSMAEK